ncbi:type II toxin-antitoxin system VapC family toxin [Gulosibacter molinativorax]|uniref:PIN domain-containing protein n=1 Tax=Gulosibacter molinativorax TaxID=256821 RepID=A0ABT7C5T1_9MICO|nr:type II toxin-antitoxin system VapC family toxin [Gulosibacter molinativorax]MDJ1370524.1 PIN domain-containing protein [Gulosibacter molinativorax]QUY62063.1 Hypotetical protein [Gulosibacter molinativorax]
MTRFYLETSTAIFAIEGVAAAVDWFDDATANHDVISSRLLQTELTRVLRRERRPVLEREDILGKISIVPMNETVLTMAEAITEHVKTLDAIHLATAVTLGANTVVVSHDDALRRVAEQLGLATYDPISAVE